jgi:7-keto-8-aminopelargonate synthetase-like enzyme
MKNQEDNGFHYMDHTLEDFFKSPTGDDSEIVQFNRWRDDVILDGKYIFEVPHLAAQRSVAEIQRITGERYKLLNLSSYNYLGYSYHPEVILAAQRALEIYGLGATGSPVLNGTFSIHKMLEEKIVSFFGLEGYGVSLFSSGYGANIGTISGYLKKGDHILLDRFAHASLVDGALLSGSRAKFFEHNDMDHLEQLLVRIRNKDSNRKILICTEGVYSADGDYGNLIEVVNLSKQYNAKVLVDEAHSFLVAGDSGRGVCEEQNVLKDVDMIIITFSKSFGGVGGCLFAREEMINYINYYARSRMFSCALDPAVTGGLIKVLELASGVDGHEKRKRIRDHAKYLREKLRGKIDIGGARSWIIPVIYGNERLTFPIGDYLQKEGLDVSLMMYPAVPKKQARIRLFVTSEHTLDQLDLASEILLRSAEKFGFILNNRP